MSKACKAKGRAKARSKELLVIIKLPLTVVTQSSCPCCCCCMLHSPAVPASPAANPRKPTPHARPRPCPNRHRLHRSLISSANLCHHQPAEPTEAAMALLLVAAAAAAFLSFTSAAPLTLLALLSVKSSLVDPLGVLRDWTLYGPPDDSSTLWSADPPWCSWTGVECTDGDVVALDLSGRNLSGVIAPELRLLSSNLTRLNLSRNSFVGPLPPVLFDLSSLLSLDVSHNDFNSTFPPRVSELRRLVVLDAYSNSFTGPVPSGIGSLRHLQRLNLGGSFFNGSVPVELGNLSKLRYLHLAGNMLTGRLPDELSALTMLEHLEAGYNSFEGGIPPGFGSLSNLRYLDISSASLSGELPQEFGGLAQLESLFLFKNALSGPIPESFAGLKALKVLDLSDNLFSGPIPRGLATLSNVTLISLMNNDLSGEVPAGIGTMPELAALLLWNNSLTGTLPQALGSNGKLEKLDVSSNSFAGPIPPFLCSGDRLVRLILFSNRFDSFIPPSLANCSSLWRVRIEGNRLVGSIPAGFGSLPNLTYMDLSSNRLSGSIPADLAVAPKLEYLNLSCNPLRSPLPAAIWRAPSLQILSVSHCGLSGSIPSFVYGCKNIYKIELGDNDLSGSIPSDIIRCERLLSLKLDKNRLNGTIPEELAELQSIADVDLSQNALSGRIPPGFDKCSTLENFNVSFNFLVGPVSSSSTVFRNLHPSVFAGNVGLCGVLVGRPCEVEGGHPGPQKEQGMAARGTAGAAIVWIAAGLMAAGLVVLILGTRWTRRREEEGHGPGPLQLTAFHRLNFTAEDVAVCVSSNDQIIGMGSTGIVYRAKMPSGEIIAVKKLWGPQKAAGRLIRRKGGVVSEVEVLGSVRHRNIVRLLGYCSNKETTLLLYEYMPNGSLEDLLHHRRAGNGGKGGERGGCGLTMDWMMRYRIAVGIAQGLCYLHHDCSPPIVHRDLKPSNILLDVDMEVRIADFGVSKLIQSANQSMSVIAGSYGYIAPEYAYTLRVDEKCDVYSYGVVLMEMVTGRRSVEAAYGEGNTIADWVRGKLTRRQQKGGEAAAAAATTSDLLDGAVAGGCKEVREEMMLALRIAVLCTSNNPKDRPSMRDVLSMLREAKPKRKLAAEGQQQGVGGGLPPAAVLKKYDVMDESSEF